MNVIISITLLSFSVEKTSTYILIFRDLDLYLV